MKRLNRGTKEATERYERLNDLGCLIGTLWPKEARNCCAKLENNHLTSIQQRKTDDLRVIRICFNHHQAQSPLPVGEAYHKGSKLFKRKYGDDKRLLALQNNLIEEHHGIHSKI